MGGIFGYCCTGNIEEGCKRLGLIIGNISDRRLEEAPGVQDRLRSA
jgi:hypothetical protein